MNFMKDEKGQSIIEALIAIAILAAVAVSFLTALSTAYTTTALAEERTTAESLARSELEYLKKSTYDRDNNPPQYNEDPALSYPATYSVSIEATRLDPDGDTTGDDDGIQEITVKVYNQARLVITMSTYKMNR